MCCCDITGVFVLRKLLLGIQNYFKIKKVHSACLEYLAPTDGTPGIGNGCQIKLAFKAAGEVNWRLGIQVDIGCRTPSSVSKNRCSCNRHCSLI